MSRKLWNFAGSKRRCLLMAGKDGEMFVTRSFNVMPKTTEQHLIARSDKSVAYVTNNKRFYSTFCTIEANYWQTWSIARPLCDSRATCYIKFLNNFWQGEHSSFSRPNPSRGGDIPPQTPSPRELHPLVQSTILPAAPIHFNHDCCINLPTSQMSSVHNIKTCHVTVLQLYNIEGNIQNSLNFARYDYPMTSIYTAPLAPSPNMFI